MDKMKKHILDTETIIGILDEVKKTEYSADVGFIRKALGDASFEFAKDKKIIDMHGNFADAYNFIKQSATNWGIDKNISLKDFHRAKSFPHLAPAYAIARKMQEYAKHIAKMLWYNLPRPENREWNIWTSDLPGHVQKRHDMRWKMCMYLESVKSL
jgi:hypothetical protein